MKRPLTIEVRGIGFPNKGAELMLLSICYQIEQRYPGARVCLSPKLPFRFRKNYPTYQIARVVRFGLDFGHVFYLLPRKLREMFGIVMPRELDVLLDASGFAYGDQWTAGKSLDSSVAEVVRFKKNGNRKVIFLPQAMGPFSGDHLIRNMYQIFQSADLVYVRDSSSMAYIQELTAAEHIRQAPDFTNLLEVNNQTSFDKDPLSIYFIPNSKMIEMKHATESGSYESFMAGLIKAAKTNGFTPMLLIHEGDKDAELAEKIAELSMMDVPIVRPDSAAQVKAVIATAKLVVSSRFHGIVSSLSQGIPVMATGWSHKYQCLLDDYGVGEYIFDEREDLPAAIDAMLNLMCKEHIYRDTVETITRCSVAEKQRSMRMWAEVFSLMDELNG